MKILHVITAFGIGGAEKLLLNTINEQIVRHEVYLVYLKKVEDLLPQLDKRVKVKNIPLTIFVSKKLRQYFKNINPDIIHTHLGHADIIGIWSSRGLNSEIFCTMHSTYFKKNYLDKIFFKIYRYLFLRVSKNIHVISISKSVENLVIKTLKVSKSNSYLLYNAIPSEFTTKSKVDIKKCLKIPQDKIILLFLGRLTSAKSVNTLLKAVKLLKNKGYGESFELLIVGDGKLRHSLESISKDFEISNIVRFEGEKLIVSDYFKIADIFILPSIWEGFGIVILEAFRAETAVIASNIEGPSELIKNNKNGLLFEPKNYVELSNKLIKLIDDSNLRQKIAEAGYESFVNNFKIERYVDKLNKLYKSVINE